MEIVENIRKHSKFLEKSQIQPNGEKYCRNIHKHFTCLRLYRKYVVWFMRILKMLKRQKSYLEFKFYLIIWIM